MHIVQGLFDIPDQNRGLGNLNKLKIVILVENSDPQIMVWQLLRTTAKYNLCCCAQLPKSI